MKFLYNFHSLNHKNPSKSFIIIMFDFLEKLICGEIIQKFIILGEKNSLEAYLSRIMARKVFKNIIKIRTHLFYP